MRERPVLISACLVGRRCRYDAACRVSSGVFRISVAAPLLAVCPEVEGGLPVPRPPAEIAGGGGAEVLAGRAWVRDDRGHDVTGRFLLGARRVLALARRAGVRRALLKSRSPSCGAGMINGLQGSARAGNGVAAELLLRAGIEVQSVEFDDDFR